MKKIILLNLILLLLLPAAVFAQTGSIAIIEYIDGDPMDVMITSPVGEPLEAYIGMEVELESIIQTGNASVEIRLDPNGTILNLDVDTFFELTSIQGRRSSDETVLTLLQGRLRTVASRSGISNRYTIKTPTAVCGIRGTEILNSVTPGVSEILCKSGSVEVINTQNSGNKVLIGANQMVNTAATVFASEILSAEQIASAFDSLPFRKLNPAEVPRSETTVAAENNAEETTGADAAEEDQPVETAAQDQPAEEETLAETPEETAAEEVDSTDSNTLTDVTDVAAAEAPVIIDTEAAQEDESSSNNQNREPSPLEQWFADNMGFEIGTVMIEGNTWAKVILQPDIRGENFGLGLYIPIIYKENMMDPNDWYMPEGNSEWSFGTDQDGWYNILKDINEDLWLKIRYLEYGDPLWDPFYISLGNLDSMTLGHGTLVKGFANNTNFPSVRKIGINTGFTIKNFGIEFLMDDLKTFDKPNILGGRLSYGKENGFGVGLTGMVDLNPSIEYSNPAALGNAALIGASLDFELFKINTDLLKLMTFADAATVIPYFRDKPTGTSFDYTDPMALIINNGVQNYGAVAGVKGKLILVNFGLELRYENGIYQHNLFNNIYDRYKLNYLNQMITYLDGTDNTAADNRLGIYGEVGLGILSDKVKLTAGYEWPLGFDGTTVVIEEDDYLKLILSMDKGLVPVYDISGAISYERIGFYNALTNSDFTLFDAKTVLSGELVLPLAPTLDLALVASSTTLYDDAGDLLMMSDGITPKIVPVFNIETRIHF